VDANRHSPARKRGGLLLLDSWGGEVVEELQPQPEEVVIVKKRTSVFFATELDLVLRGLGVKTLVLGGTATHLAVESTARDGHAHDYEVCVVSDACTALQPEFQEPSLRTVANFFGRVQTTDEVLAALGG
jgi:nicotinamidase-related amidase